MQPQAIDSLASWPADLVVPHGVLTLSGYGLDVRVWRGRLRVSDGVGRDRRMALVHRATGGLHRLVVLGHTGSITFDAIRWLADVGAGYLQIDEDGRVLAAFGPPSADQPALRRAQATASSNDRGAAITRELLRRKLNGQRETLLALAEVVEVPAEAFDAIDGCVARLESITEDVALRRLEAAAAVAYWTSWASLPVRFASRDAERVPAHWRSMGSRSSLITGGPRAATNPANAMLNYLYAIVESEITLAARIVGLDPGLGIFHVDTPHRASFSADLMEPIRPTVDRYLLDLLTRRTFGIRDFHETRTGVCRVVAPLTRELAETSGSWERLALPLGQDVAGMLLGRGETPSPYRRPRKVASPQAAERRSPKAGAPRVRTPRPRCVVCGKPNPQRSARTCSPECETKARIAAGHAGAAKLQERSRRLRAEGRNPTTTPEARARLSESAKRRRAEQDAWERENPGTADLEFYGREVFPIVQGMSLKAIQKATGLSIPQCGRIRSGEQVPHRRWWAYLVVGRHSEPPYTSSPSA
jgi:CRISPR-associated endonuclease Cas1